MRPSRPDLIDPDLFDLNHVEVLRGPQGTLYGAGSMGGTIKLVTNQPELGKLDGAAQVNASQTGSGGGTNGGGNLMLNLPIGDHVGVARGADRQVHQRMDSSQGGRGLSVSQRFRNLQLGLLSLRSRRCRGCSRDSDHLGRELERFAAARATLLCSRPMR